MGTFQDLKQELINKGYNYVIETIDGFTFIVTVKTNTHFEIRGNYNISSFNLSHTKNKTIISFTVKF